MSTRAICEAVIGAIKAHDFTATAPTDDEVRFGPIPLEGVGEWPAAGVMPGDAREFPNQPGTLAQGRYVMPIDIVVAHPIDLDNPGTTFADLLDLVDEMKTIAVANRRWGLAYVDGTKIVGWKPGLLAQPGADMEADIEWTAAYTLNLEVRFRE